MDEIKHVSAKTRWNGRVWAASADVTNNCIASLVVRDIIPLQFGNGGSACQGPGIFSLGVCQNILAEAGVRSVNLNPEKSVSNRVLFPGDVMDGTAILRYCREMMSLSGRPSILDSRGVHKGLVAGVYSERKCRMVK